MHIMTGEKGSGNGNKDEDGPNTNSPYYVHASNYPKQLHVNDLLNDNNYTDWSQEILNFLFAKNKVGFVDGTIKKTRQRNTELYALDAL